MRRFLHGASRGGFLLVEAMIGYLLFGMFLLVLSFSLLASNKGVRAVSDRAKGVFFAQQQLDAIRSMRDSDFASLTSGVHGLVFEGGAWSFSGSSVLRDDYTNYIEITDLSANEKQIDAYVSWNFGVSRSGSVLLSMEVTNWREEIEIGNWASPVPLVPSGSYDSGDTLLQAMSYANGYAYIGASASPGLYIVDVSTPSSPQRVSSSVDLGEGSAVYDVLANGTGVYVLQSADDLGREILIFDVSDPENLNTTDDLLASINIPGEFRALSLAIRGTYLLVGAQESATEDELYVYDISDPTSPSLLESLNDDSTSIHDMDLRSTYIFAATSNNLSELRVYELSATGGLVTASGGGVNVTDVQDAQAIAVSATGVLLGRAAGGTIEELIFFMSSDITPVPDPPPGPWYQEPGDEVKGLDIDPGGRYAFAATPFSTKDLQVLDIGEWVEGQNPEINRYDASDAVGQDLFYDAANDRLYFMTVQTLYVFESS